MAQNTSNDLSSDMTSDIALGKAVADFLGNPKNFSKPLPDLEVAQIMEIRGFKHDKAIRQEINFKLTRLLNENTSNFKERDKLYGDIYYYVNKQNRRMNVRRAVTLNHRQGKLKKVWTSKKLAVDERKLQSVSKKDAFDMKSLTESLPQPVYNDAKRKAKKLAKEYLEFVQQKRRSFRKSEMLRILASKVSLQNNNSISSSSKPHQTRSLTRIVKKVCGDVENVHIFSFRPFKKRDVNSCVDNITVSCPELQELNTSNNDEKSEKASDLIRKDMLMDEPPEVEDLNYRYGPEVLVLLKPSCTKTKKTQSDKQKEDSNTNILQNPKRLLFKRNKQNEEWRESTLKTQILDSISLSRQLSRLQIANSRRDDLSGDMDVFETEEASADQNKDEQEKVAIANRRRFLVERLRERYRKYQREEAQTLKRN